MDQLCDYDFAVPFDLIATVPSPQRDACRLLTLNKTTGDVDHRTFSDLVGLLPDGAVLVLNNARVLPARLRTFKGSGGACECFFLQAIDDKRAQVLMRGRAVRSGIALATERGTRLELGARLADGWELQADGDILSVFMQEGEMPLPPYILKARKERATSSSADHIDYQTVFAKAPGSVAAPTAGLHFTPALLQALKERGIDIVELTLHVGWGTFQPIRSLNIADHRMHAETFSISPETEAAIARAKRDGRPVVAVGSTSVRALESAWDAGAQSPTVGLQSTSLFIRPSYAFRVVDQMVTNFHLPRSSLLVMVSAFAGYPRIRAAYETAIRENYRFYSYGDAMWIY